MKENGVQRVASTRVNFIKSNALNSVNQLKTYFLQSLVEMSQNFASSLYKSARFCMRKHGEICLSHLFSSRKNTLFLIVSYVDLIIN